MELKNSINLISKTFSKSPEELFRVFEKAAERVENFKINVPALIFYFSFLISTREFLEQWFFSEYFSLSRFMHHFFFAFLVLMAGILIISLLARSQILKTTLVVSVGFIVVILPPLIDYFIFLRDFPYDYLLPKEFIFNFFTFFLLTPKAGLGIAIEIAAILFLASFYVLLKSRSLFRALLTGVALYFLVGLSATPRLYLPIPSMTNPVIWQSRHVIYFIFYLGLSIIIGLFFLYRINPALPKALFSELSSFRTFHFILMVIAGTYLKKNLNWLEFPDFLYIIISILCVAILWLSVVLINNVYDLEIDKISNPNRFLVKGLATSSEYLTLSLVLSIISLFVSSVLGVIAFIMTLIFLLSSLAYSLPPLRFRNRLFSTVFIGWGSVLAYFIGYFNGIRGFEIEITRDSLFIAILLFLALSIGTMTKDLKDYEGDLRCAVKTFFTIYGKQKGKRIVSVLLCLSLLIPLILYHKIIDVIFFSIVAILISSTFFRQEKLLISYFGYGIVFFYCLLKITELI